MPNGCSYLKMVTYTFVQLLKVDQSNATMQARLGRGYVGAEANKHLYQNDRSTSGKEPHTPLYSPIDKIEYHIEEIEVDGVKLIN